ncbi:MAG: ACT domain-containing protein, partial [Planctomycetota bacterium]
VVCTPHLGASTEEAQTQVAVEAAELVIGYLTTGAIRCAVNVAALDPQTLDALRGYLDVAYRLGRLAAGLQPKELTTCRLIYRGDIATGDTKVLTSAFSAGLLEGATVEEANLINASVLLADRGISIIEESRPDRGAFSSAMAVELTAGGKTRRVSGTLFGHDMPRLVEVDGFRLEAYLDGCLLLFTHKDVPGIIGGVGSALGESGVNIAQMAVGRAEQGGDALGVLNLDGEPSAAALEAVRALDSISSANVVHLPAAGVLPSWLT